MTGQAAKEKKQKKERGGWLDWLDLPDFEALLLILAVLAGWVAVELFAPALLVVACALLIGALRRVANDDHACEGQLPRSLAWGAAWATLYTLPLALVVLLVRHLT